MPVLLTCKPPENDCTYTCLKTHNRSTFECAPSDLQQGSLKKGISCCVNSLTWPEPSSTSSSSVHFSAASSRFRISASSAAWAARRCSCHSATRCRRLAASSSSAFTSSCFRFSSATYTNPQSHQLLLYPALDAAPGALVAVSASPSFWYLNKVDCRLGCIRQRR